MCMGIGLSGLYVTLRNHAHDPLAINLDQTPFVSGISLVVTLGVLLLAVPLNNWVMDRKVGWALVGVWILCTTTNVAANLGGWYDDS